MGLRKEPTPAPTHEGPIMEVREFTISLDSGVRDKISGFEGVVIGRAEYSTGCRQYLVQPRCGEDKSKKPEGQWFDEARLEVMGRASEEGSPERGGPVEYSAPIK